MGLEDPGRHQQGVTSPCAGHSPRPGPGLGLATPLAPLAQWLGPGHCTWVNTQGPKKATCGGSSPPEAAFPVSVKAAGCIPGDRLDRA